MASSAAFADDATQVTAPPPAVYGETLAKLLTPVAEVLKKQPDDGQLHGDGIVLLDETITYATEDGKQVTVYHTINKALNDAGVKSMAQNTINYKKNFQQAYLVLAQTIQPDGTKVPVKSDAVFVKTPQDEADDSVYNDELELITVYSDVKPGSLTEQITVLEDGTPRIPNEYSGTYAWIGSWPEYLQRFVLDLPNSFANRLKITNLGTDVPAPTKEDVSASRQQLTWEKLGTPGVPQEESQAPSDQIGPLVWVSTLESWDAFATWYAGLVKGTDNLSPDLKAQIDSWTKSAKDPAEMLRILYSHVARDVRYTGFELGKSDYQPHDCMSVWQRQYGDCKDKANLLRVMLAYKGITSWLTLLDTDHAGLINKANPDYRAFDHCIVYVKIGDKTLFCDPTITYGVPGLLAGDTTDRDVLVLKDGKADWEHTPPLHDTALDYDFDLKLRPNGELAGWMEMKATGYYSASYEDKYRAMTKEQVLASLQDDARTFFPNCNLADVEPLKDAPAITDSTGDSPPPLIMRAYLILTGVLNQGDGTSELKFPAPDYFLPDISDYKTRQHASYIWSDFSQLTAKIQLPPGWSATTLPSPFVYDSPTSNFQASWSADKDMLTASCSATIKQSLFSSDEWQTMGDAVTNLQSWTSKTLILSKSANGPVASATPQTDSDLVADLPTMPTGEGELNLIDSEFPADGNASVRRLALEKIATLFPSDQQAIVEAAIKLGSLDLDDNKWDAAINQVRPVEDANRAVLDVDTIAWADYIIASALAGENKNAQAIAILQKIGDNTNVNAFRRGWSINDAAGLMAATSPVAALDYADKGLDLDSDSSPSIYAFYASTAVRNNLKDRLKDRLTKLVAAKPQNLEDILLEVVKSAQSLIDEGHNSDGVALLTMLDSLSDPATTGDAFAQALKKAHEGADAATIYAKLQQHLKQLVAQSPDFAALEKKQPQFASADDAEKTRAQHVANSEADGALGCALCEATAYPVDSNFSGYFWNCVNDAEWMTRATPGPVNDLFFFKVAQLGDELPHSSGVYGDTKLLQARVLESKGQRAQASAIYDSLAKEPSQPDGDKFALARQSGNNWQELGDYTKALACYQLAEKGLDSYDNAQQAVLQAAFIQFDNGNKTEAFRLVGLLAQAVQKGTFKPSEQVGNVVILAKNSTNPPPFWDNWNAWWPQWQQIETGAGLDPVKDRKIIPAIPSLVDLGQELGTAKENKDTKSYFEKLRILAYAARFYPDAALELVGTFTSAEEVLPAHADDLRLLAISVLEPISFSDPDIQRRRILNLLVNYVDTNQNAKAMDLMAHDWNPSLADNSSVTVAIHRVWGIAAIRQRQDLDKISTALENDLKTSPDPSRALTVGVLADIYAALGRPQDAIKLIQAELTNPIIAADSSAQQNLKERLDNFQNASGITKQLADGVAAWLKSNQPAWWDYAEPKTTDDPRLAQLDQILKSPNGEFQPAELVKAGLLAPSVGSLSQDTQKKAVLQAYTTLLHSLGSQDDANKLADSILSQPSFPNSLKADFLYFFLLDTYENHQTGAFEEYLKQPVYASLPDAQKDVINRVSAFVKVDRTSSPALVAYVQSLAQHPMDSLDLGVAQDTVSILLQSGDIDSAEAIYQAAANYSFASNAGMTKPEFQLQLLKEINFAKQLKPTLDALQQTTLDSYKADSIVKPQTFDQRRNLESFDDLSDEDATAFRLYQIKTHQEELNLQFWLRFMSDLKHDASSAKLVLALIQAGLASAPDDDTKATLIQYGQWTLDLDNPSLRQQFLDLAQPYRDPVKFPETSENIRMMDVSFALRLGKAINVGTDLAGFTSPLNTSEAERQQITLYRQTKDLPKLKDTLNNLSADQLVAPGLIQITLPALETVGLNDEAALARDALNKQLYQEVLSAWFSPGGHAMQGVADDIQALDTTKDVPDGFSSFADSHIARQQQLLIYQLMTAYVDKDWNKAELAGTAFTQQFPTYYTTYWFLGRSLAELGKKEDAIKALTIYCQYSKDEIWYPDAKALLAKLSTTTANAN